MRVKPKKRIHRNTEEVPLRNFMLLAVVLSLVGCSQLRDNIQEKKTANAAAVPCQSNNTFSNAMCGK